MFAFGDTPQGPFYLLEMTDQFGSGKRSISDSYPIEEKRRIDTASGAV